MLLEEDGNTGDEENGNPVGTSVVIVNEDPWQKPVHVEDSDDEDVPQVDEDKLDKDKLEKVEAAIKDVLEWLDDQKRMRNALRIDKEKYVMAVSSKSETGGKKYDSSSEHRSTTYMGEVGNVAVPSSVENKHQDNIISWVSQKQKMREKIRVQQD